MKKKLWCKSYGAADKADEREQQHSGFIAALPLPPLGYITRASNYRGILRRRE